MRDKLPPSRLVLGERDEALGHMKLCVGAPCFIICCRNLMITLEAGRMRTWRLPRFSALKIERRQSLSTETRTMTLLRNTRTHKVRQPPRQHARTGGRGASDRERRRGAQSGREHVGLLSILSRCEHING